MPPKRVRHPQAQCDLGYAYVTGAGVSVDKVESIKWWRRSSEQGFSQAQFNLGVSYLFGEGVPCNKREGLKMIKLAAENGCSDAINYLVSNLV